MPPHEAKSSVSSASATSGARLDTYSVFSDGESSCGAYTLTPIVCPSTSTVALAHASLRAAHVTETTGTRIRQLRVRAAQWSTR